MGRYYCGSISGKFTDKQSPNIFEYFGTIYNWYNYYICGCNYEPTYDELFCQSCFHSMEEVIIKHIEENGTPISKSEIIEHQHDPIGLKYHFTGNHIPYITGKLNDIEKLLGGKYKISTVLEQLNYTIGEAYTKFKWYIECSPELYDSLISDDEVELYDMYFIGLQILKCLQETNICDIYAPYN